MLSKAFSVVVHLARGRSQALSVPSEGVIKRPFWGSPYDNCQAVKLLICGGIYVLIFTQKYRCVKDTQNAFD